MFLRKCLVDARGQRRTGRLIQVDRRATLTEINAWTLAQTRQKCCLVWVL